VILVNEKEAKFNFNTLSLLLRDEGLPYSRPTIYKALREKRLKSLYFDDVVAYIKNLKDKPIKIGRPRKY
jgi:hypothetical protein